VLVNYYAAIFPRRGAFLGGEKVPEKPINVLA
jgi:hypothetical protein